MEVNSGAISLIARYLTAHVFESCVTFKYKSV